MRTVQKILANPIKQDLIDIIKAKQSAVQNEKFEKAKLLKDLQIMVRQLLALKKEVKN